MQASQRLADCGSQAPRQAEFARLSPPGHQVMADTPPPRLYSTTYLVLSRLSLPAPVAPSLRPHARPSFLLSSNQRASGPLANIHLSFLIIIPYNSITPHPLSSTSQPTHTTQRPLTHQHRAPPRLRVPPPSSASPSPPPLFAHASPPDDEGGAHHPPIPADSLLLFRFCPPLHRAPRRLSASAQPPTHIRCCTPPPHRPVLVSANRALRCLAISPWPKSFPQS